MPLITLPTSPAASDPVSFFATTGGVDFDLNSTAPAVVLIHGAGMDRTTWSTQTRYLAARGFTVLAIDLPGHGLDQQDGLESIKEYGQWLNTLLEALAKPAVLVGHSMGTYIALEAASNAYVRSLVLVGTAAKMGVHPVLIEACNTDLELAGRLMAGWGIAAKNKLATSPVPGTSLVESTVALVQNSRPGQLGKDLAMCASYQDACKRAASLGIPVKFVLGTEDKMTPARAAQPLIDSCEKHQVVLIEQCGHMIAAEAPSQLRDEIFTAAAKLLSNS